MIFDSIIRFFAAQENEGQTADGNDGGEDGEEEHIDGENGAVNGAATGAKKKKKKKPKSKSSNSGSTGSKQTVPPSIPIGDLFPDENFPIGEIQDYPKENDG